MPGDFDSDPMVMAGQVAKANGIHEDIGATTRAMITQIDGVQDGFQGLGGTALQERKDEMGQALARINNALAAMEEAVGQAAEDYGVTDEMVQQAMNQDSGEALGIASGLRMA